MRFDLFDLQLFATIAETGSLTRASQRLHIALAAASTRIRHLEQSMGAQLLVREAKGVRLTPAGQTLLHHALKVVEQLNRMREDVSEFGQGLKGHLRIQANTTAITEFLPPALGTFLAANPHVTVDLEEHLSYDIVRAVGEGKADMGVVAGTVSTEGLQVFPYQRDSLVAVVPCGHGLSGRRRLSFAEMLGFDFVGLDEGAAIRAFLAQAASQLGKPLRVRVQLRSFDGVCRMVEANVGVAVIPESTARRTARTMKLRIIPLTDEWAQRNLKICVRELEALPLFARKLIEHLTASAQPAEEKKGRGRRA